MAVQEPLSARFGLRVVSSDSSRLGKLASHSEKQHLCSTCKLPGFSGLCMLARKKRSDIARLCFLASAEVFRISTAGMGRCPTLAGDFDPAVER